MNVRQAIARLVAGANLTEPEMVAVMNQVMTGEATPIQVAAFFVRCNYKRRFKEALNNSGIELEAFQMQLMGRS